MHDKVLAAGNIIEHVATACYFSAAVSMNVRAWRLAGGSAAREPTII